MPKVKLMRSGYREEGTTISEEGFAAIEQIIKQQSICEECSTLYSQENPQVALNRCKQCFLRKEGKSLTYVRQLTEPNENGSISYLFLNHQGYAYVFMSHTALTRDLDDFKEIPDTLRYWQFPVPQEVYEVNGRQERLLLSYHLSLYGDYQQNNALLLRYWEPHITTSSILLFFLAIKGEQECIEITKKRGLGFKLFREAKKRAEATRTNGKGNYHLYGGSHSELFDSDLFRLVADIASEQHAQIQDERKGDGTR